MLHLPPPPRSSKRMLAGVLGMLLLLQGSPVAFAQVQLGLLANRNVEALSQGAYILKGDRSVALGIVERLKGLGWTMKEPPNPQGILKVLVSPDGLQKINYREFATSVVAGHKTEATLDLFKWNGEILEKLPYEIKFVTPQ